MTRMKLISMKSNVMSNILLGIAAMISTGYLLMLGWYNTLSLDDYGFAYDLQNLSPAGWAYHMYMTWQGRFSTFFVSGIIFKLWGYAPSLFSWTVVHLLLGYCATALLLNFVLSKKDALLQWLLAILITNITICSVFDISTFYWLCCAGYFLVIYATMVLVYLLFYQDVNNWIRWIGSVLCAMYIGGSAENYTPVVLMVLGIIWLILMYNESKCTDFKIAMKKNSLLFVVCAILGIEFLAMVLAPGNKVRLSHGEEMAGFMYNFEFMPFVKKTIIANTIFGMRLLSRLLYFIVALPIFIWIGHYSSKIKAINTIWQKIVLSFIALVAVIVISVTACVFGIGYYPPLRAMSYVSFLVMAWVGYMGLVLGSAYAPKLKSVNTIMCYLALVLWGVFFGYYFYKEKPYVQAYHSYVVNRDAMVKCAVRDGVADSLIVPEYEKPYWRNTYSYLRTFINQCVGSNKEVNEFYFPYMVSVVGDDDDFKSKGIEQYYGAEFRIIGKIKNDEYTF